MTKLISLKDGVPMHEKDIELVRMLADGLRPTDIGAKLSRSSRTVESKVDELRRRTGSKTTAELVAIFFRNKLIE